MSYEKEGKENLQEQDQEHKIRITITSKNCGAIERISNELVKAAKDKNLKVKGNFLKSLKIFPKFCFPIFVSNFW